MHVESHDCLHPEGTRCINKEITDTGQSLYRWRYLKLYVEFCRWMLGMDGTCEIRGSFHKNSNNKETHTYNKKEVVDICMTYHEDNEPGGFSSRMTYWQQMKECKTAITFFIRLCECMTDQSQRLIINNQNLFRATKERKLRRGTITHVMEVHEA